MTILTRSPLSLKRPEMLGAPIRQHAPAVPEPLLARFWFVWAIDGMRPKKRHASLKLAQAEAARLRTIAPGREFYVYESRRVEDAP